jgi:hypothetical protein
MVEEKKINRSKFKNKKRKISRKLPTRRKLDIREKENIFCLHQIVQRSDRNR